MNDRKLTYDLDDQDRKILSWLSPLNFVAKQSDVLSQRHEQTGAWFLRSPELQNWLTEPTKTLFCTGIPGAGKTVLASISVDYLKRSFIDENHAVVCIFCNHSDRGQQRSIDLVASILDQLLQRKGVKNELRMLYQLHQPYCTRPEPRVISELLFSTIQEFPRVFIVIDALDECPDTERDSFIAEICVEIRRYAICDTRYFVGDSHPS